MYSQSDDDDDFFDAQELSVSRNQCHLSVCICAACAKQHDQTGLGSSAPIATSGAQGTALCVQPIDSRQPPSCFVLTTEIHSCSYTHPADTHTAACSGASDFLEEQHALASMISHPPDILCSVPCNIAETTQPICADTTSTRTPHSLPRASVACTPSHSAATQQPVAPPRSRRQHRPLVAVTGADTCTVLARDTDSARAERVTGSIFSGVSDLVSEAVSDASSVVESLECGTSVHAGDHLSCGETRCPHTGSQRVLCSDPGQPFYDSDECRYPPGAEQPTAAAAQCINPLSLQIMRMSQITCDSCVTIAHRPFFLAPLIKSSSLKRAGDNVLSAVVAPGSAASGLDVPPAECDRRQVTAQNVSRSDSPRQQPAVQDTAVTKSSPSPAQHSKSGRHEAKRHASGGGSRFTHLIHTAKQHITGGVRSRIRPGARAVNSPQPPGNGHILETCDVRESHIIGSRGETLLMRASVKLSRKSAHAASRNFEQTLRVQTLDGVHTGPIWSMKFSPCGRLLATAGQDKCLRVWVLKSAHKYFCDMRSRYGRKYTSHAHHARSLSGTMPPVVGHQDHQQQQETDSDQLNSYDEAAVSLQPRSADEPNTSRLEAYAPFHGDPLCSYSAHTADVLDISWSKNYFLLTSSMDKTVRLWHVSRRECLCCFQHLELVTAIVFHPKDDRYFLSGSLDGKLRLWNIPDKKVALWNQLSGKHKLITAANFCQNGRFAVVGSNEGLCVFYSTDQLKYHTQIHVRSSRGRNARGRKISGIEPMPGNQHKILVTSNDSRVRLYDLRDLNLACKYKGMSSNSSQITASFSHDAKYITAGSETPFAYIWRTVQDTGKFSSMRRDRNNCWEAIRCPSEAQQITCSRFSPRPDIVFQYVDTELARFELDECREAAVSAAAAPQCVHCSDKTKKDSLDKKSVGSGGGGMAASAGTASGYVLVTADFSGVIRVFICRSFRSKHNSLPTGIVAN